MIDLGPTVETLLLRALAWRSTSHDQHWKEHPAVATGESLTFGQRAADMMKAVFATWGALFGMLGFIFGWIAVVQVFHLPIDNPQLTILNLILSSLAGLQCFVLLIAAKRADQIAAQIALHTLQNTEAIKQLIEQNTALTQLIHEHITATTTPTPPAVTRDGDVIIAKVYFQQDELGIDPAYRTHDYIEGGAQTGENGESFPVVIVQHEEQ